jgi:hypothetical protein
MVRLVRSLDPELMPMTTYNVYLRLDTTKFGDGKKKYPPKIDDAKDWFKQDITWDAKNITLTPIEDKAVYHSRPELTKLLGVQLLTEDKKPSQSIVRKIVGQLQA